MLWYFAKLLLLLPLLGLLIWGSLKLTRNLQNRLPGQRNTEKSIKLLETSFLAPGIRLAVVEFRGREILLGCTRQGLVRLGEAEATAMESSGEAAP